MLRHNGHRGAHNLPRKRRDVDAVDGDARAGADFDEAQDAARERALAAVAAATDFDLGAGGGVEADAAQDGLAAAVRIVRSHQVLDGDARDGAKRRLELRPVLDEVGQRLAE